MFFDGEPFSDVNLKQPNNPVGAVKAYISIIKDKIKMPTG
jgi:hypothetical protein